MQQTIADFAARLALELHRRGLAVCEEYPGREYNEWHEVDSMSFTLAEAIRALTKCPECGEVVEEPCYGPGSNEYHDHCVGG